VLLVKLTPEHVIGVGPPETVEAAPPDGAYEGRPLALLNARRGLLRKLPGEAVGFRQRHLMHPRGEAAREVAGEFPRVVVSGATINETERVNPMAASAHLNEGVREAHAELPRDAHDLRRGVEVKELGMAVGYQNHEVLGIAVGVLHLRANKGRPHLTPHATHVDHTHTQASVREELYDVRIV
jgi:hypothetical protein